MIHVKDNIYAKTFVQPFGFGISDRCFEYNTTIQSNYKTMVESSPDEEFFLNVKLDRLIGKVWYNTISDQELRILVQPVLQNILHHSWCKNEEMRTTVEKVGGRIVSVYTLHDISLRRVEFVVASYAKFEDEAQKLLYELTI